MLTCRTVVSTSLHFYGHDLIFRSYGRVMAGEMTAAGKNPPAIVFVAGCGVAGLEAVAISKKLGAVVRATDVRMDCVEQVASVCPSLFLAIGVKKNHVTWCNKKSFLGYISLPSILSLWVGRWVATLYIPIWRHLPKLPAKEGMPSQTSLPRARQRAVQCNKYRSPPPSLSPRVPSIRTNGAFPCTLTFFLLRYAEYVPASDVIITTAAVPGMKAPVLVCVQILSVRYWTLSGSLI